MSYHQYNQSLAGIFDFLDDGGSQCPPSSAYTQMLQKANELDASWNPTGLYTWQDMADVVDAVVKLAGQASSAAIQFYSGNSTPGAKDRVRAAYESYNKIAAQAVNYVESWKQAKAAGKPIAAPGFKRWVIDDLKAAAALIRAIDVEACNAPWWLNTVVSISGFFIGVTNVARRVVGVALKVGEGALVAVERSGDILSFVLKIAPFAAVGIGGLLLYRKLKR